MKNVYLVFRLVHEVFDTEYHHIQPLLYLRSASKFQTLPTVAEFQMNRPPLKIWIFASFNLSMLETLFSCSVQMQ